MSEVLVLNPKPHDYEVGFPESPPPMNPTDGELLFPPGMTLADYVLQQFKTKTSTEIFMEKGSKLKLTGEMKKDAKNTFKLFLEHTGSPHVFAQEIDHLYSRLEEVTDRETQLALRRYINALNFRLAHYNRQQERVIEGLGESSTGLPVELLAEAPVSFNEFFGIEPGDDSPVDILAVGQEVAIPDEETAVEVTAEPERMQEPEALPEALPETEAGAPAVEAAIVESPDTEQDPYMSAVQLKLAEIKEIAAYEDRPWYKKNLLRRSTPQLQRVTSVLNKLYPHAPEKLLNRYARQLAVLMPEQGALPIASIPELINAIGIATEQPMLQPRSTAARRLRNADGTFTRRAFLGLAVTEVGAELLGVGPISQAVKEGKKLLAATPASPVGTSPTAAAPTAQPAATVVPANAGSGEVAVGGEAAPGTDPATEPEPQGPSAEELLEQQRKAQIEERERLLAEEAKQKAEALAAEQAKREGRAKELAEDLAALPRIEALGANTLVLDGEKGNFAGEYSVQADTGPMNEEMKQLLGNLREAIERKKDETGGHFAIRLTEGKYNFRYTNKNGLFKGDPIEVDINPQNNIHSMSEEQKAGLTAERKASFLSTDSVDLETSGWIFDKERNVVLIRMQSSYVGDGHQGSPRHAGGDRKQGGAVYIEVPPEQALAMAQEGVKGTSTIGCFDAYDNNKLTNLWVGLYHIGRQGKDMKQKFSYEKYVRENGETVKRQMTYDVSGTELLGITTKDILKQQYVDWFARVGTRNVKARASGICGLTSMLMYTLRKNIAANGLQEQARISTQNHSTPDIWYGPTGSDPMIFENDGKGFPVNVDTTVYTEDNNLPGRIDATLNIEGDHAITVNTGVLSYDPKHTRMLMFMNSSIS